MPPLNPVPNVFRVDHHFTFGEDANAMVHEFFSFTGTNTQADTNAFADQCRSKWDSHMMVDLNADLTHTTTDVTDLTSDTAPFAGSSSGVAGTATGTPCPAGTAFVIGKDIARRYRGGHPRMYLPGQSIVNLADPQRWSDALVALLTAAYTAYVGDIVGFTSAALTIANLVNVSYFHGFTNHTFPSGRVRPIPTPRATPLVDVVIGIDGNIKVASQRRRNLQST